MLDLILDCYNETQLRFADQLHISEHLQMKHTRDTKC